MPKQIKYQNTTRLTEQYNPVDNEIEIITNQASDASESGVGIDIDLGIGFDAVQSTSPGTEGGDFRIDLGNGGAASDGAGGVGQNAGTGGDFIIFGGDGGSASGTNTVGNGAGNAGLGGLVFLRAGTGGAGSDGTAASGAPGQGGYLEIGAGNGGDGTPTQPGGTGADLYINPGAGGADGGAGAGINGRIWIGNSSNAAYKTRYITLGNSVDDPQVAIPASTPATSPIDAALYVSGGVWINDNLVVRNSIELEDPSGPAQIILPEILFAAPSPGSGKGAIYVDTDAAGTGGRAELFYIDDTGVSTQVTCEGSLCIDDVNVNNVVNSDYSTANPTGISDGTPLYIDSSGNVEIADASAFATGFVVGFAKGSTLAAGPVVMRATPGSTITTGPHGGSNGQAVYLATAPAGNVTSTPPTASGSVVFKLGYAVNSNSFIFQPQFIALNP